MTSCTPFYSQKIAFLKWYLHLKSFLEHTLCNFSFLEHALSNLSSGKGLGKELLALRAFGRVLAPQAIVTT